MNRVACWCKIDAWEEMGKWSFGHLAMIPLDNGKWLLAYYAGTPQAMGIHWEKIG